MKRYTTVVALVATLLIAGTALAVPGPAPAGIAIAEYDFLTGEVTVSGTNVVNWYVNSASSSLTGPDDPSPPLPLSGGLVTDNNNNVGESLFPGDMTFVDISLGFIAEPGLQGDLTINSNAFVGASLQTFPVIAINVPEPTTLALAALSLCGILVSRRRCIV